MWVRKSFLVNKSTALTSDESFFFSFRRNQETVPPLGEEKMMKATV